jgi:hypothetical protein
MTSFPRASPFPQRMGAAQMAATRIFFSKARGRPPDPGAGGQVVHAGLPSGQNHALEPEKSRSPRVLSAMTVI